MSLIESGQENNLCPAHISITDLPSYIGTVKSETPLTFRFMASPSGMRVGFFHRNLFSTIQLDTLLYVKNEEMSSCGLRLWQWERNHWITEVHFSIAGPSRSHTSRASIEKAVQDRDALTRQKLHHGANQRDL